jgi:hypothetical protein
MWQLIFRPGGADSLSHYAPEACAVGCIPPPLRGYLRVLSFHFFVPLFRRQLKLRPRLGMSAEAAPSKAGEKPLQSTALTRFTQNAMLYRLYWRAHGRGRTG